jgi:serine phosphatase RsbU (regulator of sigma subunit)/ligand-binding sensor domain-containing protein
MWAGTDKGLFRIEGGKARREENLASAIVSSISADAHGNLWVGTNQGLWVRPREANAWLSVSIGQEGSPFVQGLLPDQEGNIWFMRLKGGLSRLKKGKFLHYTDPNSELGNVVNAISPYGPGRFLVAFEHGAVGLLENGSIKPFPLSTPLSGRSVKGILYDSRGTLWISTYAGLLRITKDGRETLYDPQRDFPSALIRLVFEDAQQGLWVGTRDRGLLRIDSDGRVLRTIGQSEGLGENLVLSVGNGAPGQLLVGTSGAGLAVVRAADGHVLAQHHQGTGFPSDVVFSARLDAEGRIWAATNAGLAMVEAGGQYRAFSEKNGLPNNNVYDVLEDEAGHLWLPSAKGAIRIAKQALLQEAPPEPEAFRLYDRADGLREPECNATSKALIDDAGHLWFPTVNGVASLDPRNLLANLAAPPVYVQGLWVDGDTLVPHISMSIGPEAKHFRFDFAALYFYAPQKVRFRYRLLGFETEWQEDDAQTRRAVYTNLGPGNYEFQVIAANDEGVWNNQGDALAFSVGAHFYERWWFWVLAIGALIAGIAWAYQARLNALQARQAQLEGLVKSRTQQLQEHNATLEQQREEISAQRDEIEQQHRHVLAQQASIEASIRYAQRIQEALLPRERALVRLGLQGFILFKPRDVVSGDFYWVEPVGSHIALAAADCTGHGVPGAFMSMLGVAFLNDVVKQRGITRADEVLNQLRSAVKQALRQETRNGETYDGMDMAFCLLHLPTGELRYAGAHNALCIVRSAEAPPVQANRLRTMEGNGRVLYELLPDKQPIGVFLREKPFQEQVVKVLPGDLLYLYSDGYYDQIGGDAGRKLMSRHFKQLLLEVATLPMPQQRVALQAHFEQWQGAYKQVDDVVVMGVQLPGSS